ncbi:MAG TPA: 50S ribosomal protein L21 [Kiritimatiellae bacterium]|nr:50S ribosomal protein L21 [Kiritimatiellia bacterium]
MPGAPVYVAGLVDAAVDKYAIIQTGGKQYRVQEGTLLDVERLPVEEGSRVQLEALAVHDGTELKLGTPVMAGVRVEAEVLAHFRGRKLFAFKQKRRKGYRRKIGHRQELSRIRIASIQAAEGLS